MLFLVSKYLVAMFGLLYAHSLSTKYIRNQQYTAGHILKYQSDVRNSIECLLKCRINSLCSVGRYNVNSRLCTYMGNAYFTIGTWTDDHQQFIFMVSSDTFKYLCILLNKYRSGCVRDLIIKSLFSFFFMFFYYVYWKYNFNLCFHLLKDNYARNYETNYKTLYPLCLGPTKRKDVWSTPCRPASNLQFFVMITKPRSKRHNIKIKNY